MTRNRVCAIGIVIFGLLGGCSKGTDSGDTFQGDLGNHDVDVVGDHGQAPDVKQDNVVTDIPDDLIEPLDLVPGDITQDKLEPLDLVPGDVPQDKLEPPDLVPGDESPSDVDLEVSIVDAEACGGLCNETRPYCIEGTGYLGCGECLIEQDCEQAGYADCECSPNLAYSCVNAQGTLCSTVSPVCPVECDEAADCGGDHTWMTFDCVQTVGDSKTCVDSNGRCDGTYACCAPGQVL